MTSRQLLGALQFGDSAAASPVLVALVVYLIWLAFSFRKLPLPLYWKWGLFALKGSAVVLLAFCLLDPRLVRRRLLPGENIVAVLADDSASQNVRSTSGSPITRGEEVRQLLSQTEAPWQVRLSQDFDVRRYLFGAGLNSVDRVDGLTFENPASHLSAAVTSLRERFAGRPLAAVLVFTDGHSTDGLPAPVADHPVPVYAVVPDREESLPDLGITQVAVSQTNFEDAPVTIQAEVSVCGPDERVQFWLEPSDPTGGTVQKQTVEVRDGRARAEFRAKPLLPGALFYRLRTAPGVAGDSPPSGENSREATWANNERLIAVNRDARVYRILYLGGRPNWELKFLNRSLADDPRLQLVSLVRIAKKEGRFDFRGRAGESSNPLFRGFKESADAETEAYDQPVLLRLNTRDENELSDGFPRSKNDLYAYDAVILDDVEAGFLSHDQMSLLERFVSERGGGLLMLGGRDSFRHGGWQNTPVADVLPVYLDAAARSPGGTYSWKLTRDGWLEPWVRLRETEEAEQARLAESVPLAQVNPVRDAKPGSRVLAEVRTPDGTESPALVVQQYGRGRTGAVLIGDMWKWSLQAPEDSPDDPAKAWRQIARWLVGDVPQRMDVSVQPLAGEADTGMQIQIRLRDPEFQPRDGARIDVMVEQPDGSVITVVPEPSLEEPGLSVAEVPSKQAGSYVAKVTAPGDDGGAPFRTSLGWSSQPTAREMQRIGLNRPALEELTSQTGGAVISVSELDDFVHRLSDRELPVMKTESTPLWHQAWVLLGALALLALEWGLRRWKGLA